MDELWIVSAPVAAQRRRLQERGLDDDAIAARLAAQQPWEDKAGRFLREPPPRPVVILDNGGTPDELAAQVERLWRDQWSVVSGQVTDGKEARRTPLPWREGAG